MPTITLPDGKNIKFSNQITGLEVAEKISNIIYDISANNKFFSKIYAELYAEIVNKYEFTRDTFNPM